MQRHLSISNNMLTKAPSRRKQDNAASTPAPHSDHRKTRRSKFTFSCLNCYIARRKCDRKEPTCGRCTRMGLSESCIYEVEDENSKLLIRIAELEGVIRKSQNTSSPHYAHPSCSGEEYEKWHTQPQGSGHDELPSSSAPPPTLGPVSLPSSNKGISPQGHTQPQGSGHDELRCSSDAPPPPVSLSSLNKGISPHGGFTHPEVSNTLLVYPDIPSNSRSTNSGSLSALSSSTNGFSQGVASPTDKSTFSPAGALAASQASIQSYDPSSIFSNYPATMPDAEAITIPSLQEDRGHKQAGHCGCIRNATYHHIILELSFQLRMATDVLSRWPTHYMGSFCPLNQQILNLDYFTMNLLSDIATSSSDLSQPQSTEIRHKHATLHGSFAINGSTKGPHSK